MHACAYPLDPVPGALTVIHTSLSVARLDAVRWLMNARYICWPKASPMWNTLTFDILPFFRMATIGELLVLVAYFIALIVFTAIGVAEYNRTQRDVRYILGYLTSLHLALVMLPVNRNSPFLYLCGVPFERALNWHRVMGRATMVFLVGHAIHSVVAYKANNTSALVRLMAGRLV